MASGGQAAAAAAAAAAAKAKAASAAKPKASKTSYSTPAVIAKPAATVAPKAKTVSGGYSGIPLTTTTTKPVTSTKTGGSTGGSTAGGTTVFGVPGGADAAYDKKIGFDRATNTYVDTTPSTDTPLKRVVRVPVYDANGKLIGYNVTTYNSDGSIESVTFEPVAGAEEEKVLGTTNIQVLKSMLIATGLSSALVEASTTFLQSLLKDGLSEEAAVDIYLNSKEFTTKTGTVLTSPFYSAYGFYNEALTAKLSAADLFNTVEGYKSTQTKYAISDKFASQEYIQKYLKNKISVATLDSNANKARLAAINADPLVVKNLQELGYIGVNADLTDFYLDPNVGMEKMQQNFNTAALSYEAVRRSNTGITFNKANFEKLGAELTAQGYTEEQAKYRAGEVYNTIGRELRPTVSVSNIYEGTKAGTAPTIQSELEQQEFNQIESLRVKKLKELETRTFQAETGMAPTGLNTNYLRKTSSAGQF